MKSKLRFQYLRSALVPGLIAIALLASMPARAGIVVTIGSAIVNPGATGASLDVTLSNTGNFAQNIAGFNFDLSTSNTDITFTSINISTLLPYIFNDSLFGPDINLGNPNPGPGQLIDASDLSAGVGTNVAAGQTLGLGHVLFDISPSAAAGLFTITLNASSGGGTSFSDVRGGNVAFSGVNGSITINGSEGVPEPSTLWLTLLAIPALPLLRRRYR